MYVRLLPDQYRVGYQRRQHRVSRYLRDDAGQLYFYLPILRPEQT